MRRGIIMGLPILASIISLLVGLHPVSAQNATNMTAGANMTNATTGGNMTTSNTSTSSAKMHLEEGIKALQSGDKEGATTHLGLAQQAMSGSSPDAIMHFEEGMKALDSGDTKGAIMHLQIAEQSLG
jgi:galactose mutarotase-like enzyme